MKPRILLTFLLILSVSHGLAAAATYYVSSSTSSGSPCSQQQPCKPASVWTRVDPGDTVIFLDGTYKGDDYMLEPPQGLSGTQSNPITVRTETDGGVLFNGEFARTPVNLRGNRWFILEGMNACCSDRSVVRIGSSSNHNIVRRVVAWDAADSGLGVIDTNKSDYNLFEDCAGFGVGRKIFTGTYGDHVTWRRTWARWEGNTTQGPKMAYTMYYHATDRTCENCIGTWDNGSMPATYYLTSGMEFTWSRLHVEPDAANDGCTTIDQARGGLSDDRHDTLAVTNTKVYGSIFYIRGQTQGTLHCFSSQVGAHDALFNLTRNGTSDGITVENVAIYVDPSNSRFNSVRSFDLGPGHEGAGPPNNLFIRDVTGISQTADEIDDEWSTSDLEHASSVGALGDTIYQGDGARVCYRYVDGQEQVGQPLWPWPMQDRIRAATTLASASNHKHRMNVCNETTCTQQMVTDPHAVADVMGDIVSMFGPVPSACFESDDGGNNGQAPPPPAEVWRTDSEE